MTWFKVDDSFHSHPKQMAASLAAIGLWSVAGSWSSNHLKDGFVPDHVIPSLSRGQVELAKELVAAGLWRRTKGGYQFHEWDADADGTPRNPTREEAIAGRRKMSSGGALGNHRRWHVDKGRADPSCRYCQDKHDRAPDRDSDRVPDALPDSGASRPSPVPTRPDPTRGSLRDQGEGDQSVRARARVNEALGWLATTYRLTDHEASIAWKIVEARARDPIHSPVKYLLRMVEHGHLADIVKAIQDAARDDEPQPEPPQETPPGPSLTLLEGHATRSAASVTQPPILGFADPPEPPPAAADPPDEYWQIVAEKYPNRTRKDTGT